MNFLELKEQFENKLSSFKFELLELHYTPYAFGSGTVAYRIKGRVIKIILDCKDSRTEISYSKPHQPYPNTAMTIIFNGSINDSTEAGITKLSDFLTRG